MRSLDEPALYGLSPGNSNRSAADLWGKNQFNSNFPVSLCIYMRDNGIGPVAVTANNREISAQSACLWQMEEIVGAKEENPRYLFEHQFDPYLEYARKESDSIDLVVAVDGTHVAPREIKLTVIPDSSTVGRPPSNWGPELVMRPVSSAHAMMSIGSSLKRHHGVMGDVVEALRPAYNRIDDWNNKSEIQDNVHILASSLGDALEIAEPLQRPFLIQPVWKTEGQSLALSDRCFDVFVWSDVTVLLISVERSTSQVTRVVRECARHVRGLFELLTIGNYSYTAIYKGMSLGLQTSKSFSISGRATSEYLSHPRLRSPLLSRDALRQIVLNRGERELKPERRFDAAVIAQMLRN